MRNHTEKENPYRMSWIFVLFVFISTYSSWWKGQLCFRLSELLILIKLIKCSECTMHWERRLSCQYFYRCLRYIYRNAMCVFGDSPFEPMSFFR